MAEEKSLIGLVSSGRRSYRKSQQQQKLAQIPFFKQGIATEQTEDLIHQGLFKRFQTFLMNQKLIKLNSALKNHYGRNYPIPYKSEFGFTEYWEDKKNKYEQSNNFQYFQYPYWYYYIFAFIILVSKAGLIWITSIHRIFKIDEGHGIDVLSWALITLVVDISLQYKLLDHYEYFKEPTIWTYIQSFWKDIALFVFFALSPFHFSIYNQVLFPIDLVITAILYKRCTEIRKCFKLQVTSTSYKDLFDLIQLFTTLLPIGHIFALMLYSVAQYHPQKNWLTVNQLNTLQPLQKYIYSLYFALTTMLTVGYGDISPVNIAQIITILLIQIIGIITYGYIVNQIGHIISHMRKLDDILSHDISTISKMAKYYDLDKGLVEKAKNYLVCQKQEHADLTPEEEDSTLKKLHDDLREEISRQNALRILKSSLFYVCNWTKRFQIQIAKKVHKKIFSPNEEIIQIPGKERIYIFKKGKVELHANRYSGYKKHFKKILRVIEPNQTMEVSDNIYGYSFVLSNTPIKLTAINKEFVVAYYVEKKDFLETVMDSHLDSEYFFEMKTKIDSTNYPESWEAPLIINTKQHYFPSIQCLIKKNKHSQRTDKNLRTNKPQLRRFRKRSKRVYFDNIDEIEGQIISHQYSIGNSTSGNQQILFPNEHMDSSPKGGFSSATMKTIDNRSTTAMSNMADLIIFKRQNFHHYFEQGRQYSIFFKKSNKTAVIQKLENSNYLLNTKKSMKFISTKRNVNLDYLEE